MQAFQLFLNKEKNLRPRTNYPAFTRATAWHKWLSRLARNWSFIIKAAKVRFPPCGEVGAKSCLGRKVRIADLGANLDMTNAFDAEFPLGTILKFQTFGLISANQQEAEMRRFCGHKMRDFTWFNKNLK